MHMSHVIAISEWHSIARAQTLFQKQHEHRSLELVHLLKELIAALKNGPPSGNVAYEERALFKSRCNKSQFTAFRQRK